ncbi:glycosyltransferase family 39 protein [Paenibacillus radicis (ex Gao et al. 2016)]|uniref:Membrane protein n=1 Tax=Paenibacillus radicis (ex Gao et al. 2016) TaxID=1737354 RepID=A0A917HD08_9BACL|nr:glycosyltransferase family 39 protein [Paenibacillus radicis (ex Gao et al. 2016)]GGG74626.1 membrane protein [Paenibacillus radicis (ex Gao et al. 2016)]
MEIARKSSLFASRGLLVLGCLLFATAFISSTLNAFYTINSPLYAAGAIAAAVIIMLAASYGLNRIASRVWFTIGLIGVALAARLVWILWIDTPPASDFLFMYTAAQSAAVGDFSFNDTEYFSAWVYQMGFTMYEALVISLFNEPMLILKLINVFVSSATVWIVYKAGSSVFNERSGRIAGFAYALYMPNIMMCSVLSNQHFSTLFFMMGCMVAVAKRWQTSRSQWLVIGLCFGLGQLFRPIGGIFIAGLAVYLLICHLLPQLTRRRLFVSVTKLAGVIAVFYAIQLLVSSLFMQAGYTEYPLTNREPYWKFMVGLNAATDGKWSLEDGKYVLQYKLGEERDAAELAVVKERLQDKAAVAALFARKLVFFWGAKDDAAMWSLGEMNLPVLQANAERIERASYAAMSLFGVLALIALLKRRTVSGSTLFLVLLLGYAAIHLAIEIQARYRLDLMPAFIILQSYGVYWLLQRLRKFKGH